MCFVSANKIITVLIKQKQKYKCNFFLLLLMIIWPTIYTECVNVISFLLKLTSPLKTIYCLSLHMKRLYFVENLISLVQTYIFCHVLVQGWGLENINNLLLKLVGINQILHELISLTCFGRFCDFNHYIFWHLHIYMKMLQEVKFQVTISVQCTLYTVYTRTD